MDRSRTRTIIVTTAALLMISAGAAIFFWIREDAETPPNRPFAPMQANPFWVENGKRLRSDEFKAGLDIVKIPRGVFLRDGGPGITLVKFANSDQPFKYRSSAAAIEAASAEEWIAGLNEIDCQKAQYVSREALDIDDAKGVIRKRGTTEVVPTYAKFAADLYESPIRGFALVLSSAGPYRNSGPSLVFGLGGRQGGILGIRYAQIYDLNRGTYTREAVALNSSAEFPHFGTCWSPDGQTAVVYEFAIVSTFAFETNFHAVER